MGKAFAEWKRNSGLTWVHGKRMRYRKLPHFPVGSGKSILLFEIIW